MKKIKDPISGFSHLIGAIASVIGLVFLIVMASFYSSEIAWDIVSFTIFGIGLILLYTFSSLYHLLNVGTTATNVLRKFDHIMIYILIASTYTDFNKYSDRRIKLLAQIILNFLDLCLKNKTPLWKVDKVFSYMNKLPNRSIIFYENKKRKV